MLMNNAFANALPVLASALADKVGVKVVMNADRAYTNGKVIFLPPLDSNKPNSAALALGYVTHEAGHVHPMGSNFQLAFATPLEKMIDNLLEDIRIEKLMASIYPGCKRFLHDLVRELVADKWFKAPEEGDSPVQLMQGFMLYQLRKDILGQDAITPLADRAAELVEAHIPAGMRTRLVSLMYQVDDCSTEDEVLDLTRAIIKMMQEEAKKEEQKEQEQKEQQQQQGGQQDQSGDSSGQQQDGKSGADQSGDSSSQQGQASGDASQDAQQGGEGAGDGSNAPASQIIQSILSASEDDAIADTGTAVQQALDQAEVASNVASAATPFQIKAVSDSSGDVNAEATERLYRVSEATNALRHRAQSLLQAKSMSSHRNVQSGRKLNVTKLHRAPTCGAIFKKKMEAVAVDTAIAILVDRSSSMRLQVQLAYDAALATSMAFQSGKVKTSVFAFPYMDNLGMLKDWEVQATQSCWKYVQLGVEGTTPLAQSLMAVGINIIARKEPRKIILVATDGEPDNRNQAKWVIDLARKSGIEVIGLGIQHDTSSVFGSEFSTRLDDINELATKMIEVLDSRLL